MPQRCALFVFLFSGVLGAQTCPAVNFFSTPQLTPSGSADLVITRQPDGSFTGYGLSGPKPAYTIPDIQNSIVNCYPGSARRGPKPVINFNPTGTASEAGAIVDLNGSGTPALLVAETNPGVVIYYDFNLGDVAQLLPQIVNPNGLSVADLNGDGRPDLVVLDSGDGTSANMGGLYVLINNGDGTFKQTGHYSVVEPTSVAIADVNGDGKPDLVAGSLGTTAAFVAVLLGNGDGTFQSPANIPAATPVFTVLVADFNRDGNPDIAAVTGIERSSQSSVTVYLGNGKGGFTLGPSSPAGGDAFGLAAGDFNGDGKIDLAAGNADTQTIAILLGNGDGTFQPPNSYVSPMGPTEVTVTDFNNDGYADVVVGVGSPTAIGEGENSGVIAVLLGNGDGTFVAAKTYPIAPATSYGAAEYIAAADFNGDGKLDAVVGDNIGNLVFFAGNGDGTFQSPRLSAGQPSGPAVAGDFNADKSPDLAIAQAGGVSILLNAGNGSFQTPITVSSSVSSSATGIAAADFNGDGNLDVAVSYGGTVGTTDAGAVVIYRGGGNGSLTLANTYTAGLSPGGIAAADLNHDGKPDLVVADLGYRGVPVQAGAVYVFLNKGDGSFGTPTPYPVSTVPNLVAIGDLNGDGIPDLAVTTGDDNSNYWIGVLFGNGDGTFQAATLIADEYGATAIQIADLNGDGNQDILVAHYTDMTYFLGHVDGTFDAGMHFNGGAMPSFFAIGDLNGDGKPDLMIAGSPTGQPVYFTPLLNLSIKAQPLGIASSAPAPAGSPVAAESIASAYGSDLANQTASATTLGTSLGGTTASVQDSAGATRAADLFFVSPGQVNFLVPQGTANGTATVTVQSGDGTTTSGIVQIVDIAPGLYSVNAAGLAAAYAIYADPDGSRPRVNVAKLDPSTNQIVANPISLDPRSTPVFLEMYGTGFRHAAMSDVSVTIGSLAVTPSYAGAQPSDAGLDQIDVPIPYSLKGSGDVPVVVSIAGQTVNTVRITIQ